MKKYRTEEAVLSDIAAAGTDSKKLQALRHELGCLLAAGASECPNCGSDAFGMRKRADLIEIGCLGCTAGHRTRGTTVEAAVAKWNAEDFMAA